MFHRYASENFCVLVLRHGPPCTEQRMVLPAKYYYSRSPSCCALAAFSLCSVASFALFAFSSVGVDIALSRRSPYYSTLIHSFFPFFPHLPYPAPYFAVSPPKPRKRKSPASFGPFCLIPSSPLPCVPGFLLSYLSLSFAFHAAVVNTHTFRLPSIPSHSFGFWLSLCCI